MKTDKRFEFEGVDSAGDLPSDPRALGCQAMKSAIETQTVLSSSKKPIIVKVANSGRSVSRVMYAASEFSALERSNFPRVQDEETRAHIRAAHYVAMATKAYGCYVMGTSISGKGFVFVNVGERYTINFDGVLGFWAKDPGSNKP